MSKLDNITCTGAIFVLPDGRWAMQRRTNDAPTDPDCLSFFGGKTEKGETPIQCFEREISEETDIDLKKYPYSLAAEFEIEHWGRMLHIILFRVDIPTMDFAVYEGKRAEAFTLEELSKRTDVSSVVPKAIQIVTEKKHGA